MIAMIVGLTASVAAAAEPPPGPLSDRELQQFHDQAVERIEALTPRIKQAPDSVELYSRRGDANFFAARFADATADYDRMLILDPKLANPHWRRGLSLYYEGKFAAASQQFADYYKFDQLDRENGLWKFFCDVQASNVTAARQGLLKYGRFDREPFPDLYLLIQGEKTGPAILTRIQEAKITDRERSERLFFAEMYLGIDELLQKKDQAAILHLEAAARNRDMAGTPASPNYMGQVARLQYLQLRPRPAPSK